MTVNLYDVLGLPRDATDSQIRKAYHQAALKYHPDKTHLTGDADPSMWLKILEAFTVLSNESLRTSYDRELEIRESVIHIDRQRQALIDDLAAREAQAQAPSDPLDLYRRDVKNALREMNPKRDSLSFFDYRRIILSSLCKHE
jgi:DnaJ-class molecular chaperone